jgi:two-component system, NarL family, nitrate/nitrite response regulator NarL
MSTTDQSCIRIVLADDHALFRDALRAVLSTERGFAVVAQARDGDEAVNCVLEHRPDVLLLDLDMPRASGLDALKQMRALDIHGVRTVILTAAVSRPDVLAALTLGASGVLLKEATSDVLCDCIRTVAKGDYWLDGEHLQSLVQALNSVQPNGRTPSTPAESLTNREREIVVAVLSGATNRDIGASLNVSEQTVKNHLSSIFDKVGVSSRLELALYAAHRRIEPQDEPFDVR